MLYFRFPFSPSIYFNDEKSAGNAASFVSFDEVETLNFSGNIKEILKDEFLKAKFSTDLLCSDLIEFRSENQDDYEKKIEDVIHFVQENKLSKLVISRRKLLDYEGLKINLSQTFLNLCESYPNAFVYVFIKDQKCWIGAFSEILGKFNKKTGEFETMSLAGTLPLNENWTRKEIEEQKPVTGFIKNILNNFSTDILQSETYDHLSGNIKHLRTDFKIKIDQSDLEKLISELHPTPAVCGIPRDFCKNAIAKFEAQPRKLYAGYIRLETENDIQYFVNLRCAEVFRNTAILYVGGGITAESTPEKEWQETELKAEAVLKNISFI